MFRDIDPQLLQASFIRRMAGEIIAVTSAFFSLATGVFMTAIGLWSASVSPSALHRALAAFVLAASTVAFMTAVEATIQVLMRKVRPRVYSPRHWSGWVNIALSAILAATAVLTCFSFLHWPAQSALLTASGVWVLAYGSFVPRLLEWKYARST